MKTYGRRVSRTSKIPSIANFLDDNTSMTKANDHVSVQTIQGKPGYHLKSGRVGQQSTTDNTEATSNKHLRSIKSTAVNSAKDAFKTSDSTDRRSKSSGTTTANKPLPPLPRSLGTDMNDVMRASHADSLAAEKQAKRLRRDRHKKARSTSRIPDASAVRDVPLPRPDALPQEQSDASDEASEVEFTRTPSAFSIRGARIYRKLEGMIAPDSNQKVTTKRSRFQKGKEVYERVKEVLRDRLSSSVEKGSSDGKRSLRYLKKNGSRVTLNDHLGSTTSLESVAHQRRLAEGRNLSNSKIRSLAGLEDIPPIPGTSSGEPSSVKCNTSRLEDPFSDSQGPLVSPSTALAAFKFDLKPIEGVDTSSADSLPIPKVLPEVGFGASSSRVPRDPRSPLKRHPHVEVFTSSPVDVSTPRSRLAPTHNSKGGQKVQATSDSPTSQDHGSVRHTENPIEADQILSDTEGSKKSDSLKRKKLDLKTDNTNISRPMKKSKQAIGTSNETEDLTASMQQMHTGALTLRDSNVKVRDRGVDIFDAKKSASHDGSPKGAVNRPKRSTTTKSIRRKGMMASTASSWSLAGTPTTDDPMCIDELQLDLSEYQVGNKRH